MVGIPQRTIRAYEKDERLLTAEKFAEIKDKLGYHDADRGSLEVLIDYMRITFKDVRDLDFFTTRYLHCPLAEFESFETKLMMYTHIWKRGDIWIFDYADKSQTDNYQITLQFSGAGCRQMELVMERDGFTWQEMLSLMLHERKDMQVRRLDIAMDELFKGFGHEDEHIQLSDLIVKLYQNELVYEKMKSWNSIDGGKLDGSENQGLSIYFGSRQSNMYFNFYEKRFELARKEKMSVTESLSVYGVWNRYEIRLAKEMSQEVIEEFVNGVDLAEIARGLINSRLMLYNGTNEYGAFLPDSKWQSLFGGTEPLRLSMKPEAYNIEKTIKWLVYQVSNSLALVDAADKKLNTKYLEMVLKSGELGEKEEKILSQLGIEDKEALSEALENVV